MKRIFALFLFFLIVFSLIPHVFAADNESDAADFRVERYGSELRLSNAPEGFTLVAAAYRDTGRLITTQTVESPGDSVEITVSGTTTRLFFLVDNAPFCPQLDFEKMPDLSDYAVDRSGAIPVETGTQKLSSTQLAALTGKTPEQAAASISTLADAYAWLRQEGYSTTGMDGINGIENGIVNGTDNKDASWTEISTVLNVLLLDDYDEVGTVCAQHQCFGLQYSRGNWHCYARLRRRLFPRG